MYGPYFTSLVLFLTLSLSRFCSILAIKRLSEHSTRAVRVAHWNGAALPSIQPCSYQLTSWMCAELVDSSSQGQMYSEFQDPFRTVPCIFLRANWGAAGFGNNDYMGIMWGISHIHVLYVYKIDQIISMQAVYHRCEIWHRCVLYCASK